MIAWYLVFIVAAFLLTVVERIKSWVRHPIQSVRSAVGARTPISITMGTTWSGSLFAGGATSLVSTCPTDPEARVRGSQECEKGAKRCSICSTNWPNHDDFALCPNCDEDTWYSPNNSPKKVDGYHVKGQAPTAPKMKRTMELEIRAFSDWLNTVTAADFEKHSPKW